jgi:hypothetical protein
VHIGCRAGGEKGGPKQGFHKRVCVVEGRGNALSPQDALSMQHLAASSCHGAYTGATDMAMQPLPAENV